MSIPVWHEEPISSKHDRDGFDCDDPPLNEFLRLHARQSPDKGAAKTFLAISNADSKAIPGFYSLCPAAIKYARAPEIVRRGLATHDSLIIHQYSRRVPVLVAAGRRPCHHPSHSACARLDEVQCQVQSTGILNE